MDSNSLYYGDNLDILRRYVSDESVDLIYLDPPFNSNQSQQRRGYCFRPVLRMRHDHRGGREARAALDWDWDWDRHHTYSHRAYPVSPRDSFGKECRFELNGEPTSLPDARALAKQDPYQFQWWALGLARARPVEQKKGADRGIDGRLYFHDEGKAGTRREGER